MTRHALPLWVVAVVAVVARPAPADFIGVSWSGDVFVISADGTGFALGPSGWDALNSMAQDSTGQLATANDAASPDPPALIVLDPVTGVGARYGSTHLNSIRALAYAPDDTLYIADGSGGVRFLYIWGSGSNTFIGQLNFGSIQGMTFAPDGTLYGWAVSQGLVTINPETAEATDVNDEVGGTDDIQTIAFGPDGTLYGIRDQLFTIDLITGESTLVGSGGYEDVRGFEWVDRLGGCCDWFGSCIGDLSEGACISQGYMWHPYASCGADPDLPPPSCNVLACLYDNGPPLDDKATAVSQYAPDFPLSAEVADDFILPEDGGNSCLITSVTTWVGHNVQPPGGQADPATQWTGVRVTIYDDTVTRTPSGLRGNDGSFTGTVVYTELVDMATVTATPHATSCQPDVWKIDIPLGPPGLELERGRRYWLVVQPEMEFQFGLTVISLSQNSNGLNAQRHSGIAEPDNWMEVGGNLDACPPDTPPPHTRRDMAFVLYGEQVGEEACFDTLSDEVVCHGDGPTFTYNAEGLNTCTGDLMMVTFTASGGAVGEELCFTITVYDDEGGLCCTTQLCVPVPDCSQAALPCDVDGDAVVGVSDFLLLLAAWGANPGGPPDLDGDGIVGIGDFLILLGAWGPCP
ncbi:MAG: hypothetical protein ACYS15_16585 [Planctomycetota bacterium]